MIQDIIRKNLNEIRERIVPFKPNIVAVTKYFDETAIVAAYACGLRDFAESRTVEAIEKIYRLPSEIRETSRFHFIGHLQGNKVRKTVENFDLIQSVDSLKLAVKISDVASGIGKVQDVLLQLNNANEIQKFGFSKPELFENFSKILCLPNVRVKGLMSMSPLGADEALVRGLYSEISRIKSELEAKFDCVLSDISMGMSQDYVIAAQEGATMLRIGRKLFS